VEEGAQHDSGAAEEISRGSLQAELEGVAAASGDLELTATEESSIEASQAVVDVPVIAQEELIDYAPFTIDDAELNTPAAVKMSAVEMTSDVEMAAAETTFAVATAVVVAEGVEAGCAPEESPVEPPAAVRAAGKNILPSHAELEAHGWQLVQHCCDRWHEAGKGGLDGTAEYGIPQGESPQAPTWALVFKTELVVEFLFATGDGSKWLTLPLGEVAKLRAAALGSEVSLSGARSSLNPRLGSVRARRDASGELWLGLSSPLADQGSDGAGLVYGTGAAWASNVRGCGGANVYIRAARWTWDPTLTFNNKVPCISF